MGTPLAVCLESRLKEGVLPGLSRLEDFQAFTSPTTTQKLGMIFDDCVGKSDESWNGEDQAFRREEWVGSTMVGHFRKSPFFSALNQTSQKQQMANLYNFVDGDLAITTTMSALLSSALFSSAGAALILVVGGGILEALGKKEEWVFAFERGKACTALFIGLATLGLIVGGASYYQYRQQQIEAALAQ